MVSQAGSDTVLNVPSVIVRLDACYTTYLFRREVSLRGDVRSRFVQYMTSDEPVAREAIEAIESGAVERLQRLLEEHRSLATTRVVRPGASTLGGCRESRTLLHVLTDWPGNRPRGAETVSVLVAAGADVNARFEGSHEERPLHWAASCDDIPVLDALLDHGADMEAPGAVIGGGTALADAVAFGQWQAARRLVDRGARTVVWQAAALGLLDRVQRHFEGAASSPNASEEAEGGNLPSEVTHAFWCACHGGQREVASYLLGLGADRNWIGYDHLTPLEAARRSGAEDLVRWWEQLP